MQANDYLNQVVQEQAKVEGELRARKRAAAPFAPAAAAVNYELSEATDASFNSAGAAPVDYRITGWFRWKTVVVPPNAYVVHTRRGQPDPVHVGLGISFRYNPNTDAFLVIPAAVQTLLINARCISAERQGVLVQAYVQWVVDDVRTAYRRLDFSDSSDPMRIVNVQLREQAEAAIKDKVATMPIDDILSDKQPIIEELTTRLRGVAEGTRVADTTTGLGLKIVTVQIKEAVVSSTRLWENLQKPFRAEREKLARMAELEAQQQIATRELEIRQLRETAEIESARHMAELRARQAREAYDREQQEKARQHKLEQEAEQRALAERALTEKARRLADEELARQRHELEAAAVARELEAVRRQLELERARAELEKLRSANTIEREEVEHAARARREEREVEVFARRRAAENDLSEAHLRARLVEQLPRLAEAMPRPDELRAVTVNGDGAAALAGLLAGALQIVDRVAKNGQAAGAS